MFTVLYDLILFLALLFIIPRELWKKSVDGLKQRFGYGVQPVVKGSRQLVWVHAVSVGETKAASALVEKLIKTMDDPIVVVSSITMTGHAEAIRAMPFAERHIYLPLDFSWMMKRLLRKITPDLVILVETDYWYHFLNEARRQGASIALINGKLSERSTGRYCWLKGMADKMFSVFDVLCVQSREYLDRFISVGVAPEKLVVTGNLKFDSTMPALSEQERTSWRERLGMKASDRVVTAGSTHDPEEKLILTSCRPLWELFPDLKLILVPRHPERFDEVAELLRKEQIPFRRHSEGDRGSSDAKVILVDAMGVLKECYQIADIAIVAGSFTERVGGHNILEPCHYGVPTLFGPCMHTQPELERLVLEAGAGIQVKPEALTNTMKDLLMDASLRESYGTAAKRFIDANRGSVERTLSAIQTILP